MVRNANYDAFYERAGDRLAFVISASQLDSFASRSIGCHRKWFAHRVMKMRPPQTSKQGRGDIIHAVCERYNKADELGYGPDGQPLELFPKGWSILRDNEGKIVYEMDPHEKALTKQLVEKAIEEGLLVRMPGRRPEHEFWLPVINTDEVLVELMGYADLATPPEAIDYKSCTSTKYNLSKTTIAEDLQMLVYGKVLTHLFPGIDTRILSHIYFVYDKERPRVRKVSSSPIPSDYFGHFWENTVVRLAHEMVKYKKIGPVDPEDAVAWFQIRGPSEGSRACSAYGGCPYDPVCSSLETAKDFLQRTGQDVQSRISTQKSEASPAMGTVFDRLKKPAGNAPAAVNPPPIEAPAATTPVGAPWGNPECKGCSGSGFNSKGGPCKPCADTAQTRGCAPLSMFEISDLDPNTGGVSWRPAPNMADALKALNCTMLEGTVKISEPVSAEASTSAPADSDPTEPSTVQATVALAMGELEGIEVSQELSGAKRPKGRKARTFTLCLHCAPMHDLGAAKAVYADTLMFTYGEAIAAKLGNGQSYALMDVWARRKYLAALVPAIVETLKGSTVIVRSGGPDTESFVEALAPHADEVYGKLS